MKIAPRTAACRPCAWRCAAPPCSRPAPACGTGAALPPLAAARPGALLACARPGEPRCARRARVYHRRPSPCRPAPVPVGSASDAGAGALPGPGPHERAHQRGRRQRATRSASRCACRSTGTAASSTRPTAGSTASWCRRSAASAAVRPTTNALQMGFAVISSDAGHAGCAGPALRPRSAGAARLRLQRGRAAHADGQEPDRARPTAAGPIAPTSAAAPTAAGMRWSRPCARPTSTTASSSATRASTCRRPRWRSSRRAAVRQRGEREDAPPASPTCRAPSRRPN